MKADWHLNVFTPPAVLNPFKTMLCFLCKCWYVLSVQLIITFQMCDKVVRLNSTVQYTEPCLVDIQSKANSKRNQISAFFHCRKIRENQVEDLRKQTSKIGGELTSSRNFINCLMKAQKQMERKERKGEIKKINETWHEADQSCS